MTGLLRAAAVCPTRRVHCWHSTDTLHLFRTPGRDLAPVDRSRLVIGWVQRIFGFRAANRQLGSMSAGWVREHEAEAAKHDHHL